MKEQLLELLNNSKNFDKFFIFISKEKNAGVLREIIDKELSKAYQKDFERDRPEAEKIFPKTLKEALSSGRYIASTIMETKKFGGRFFFEEKGIHTAVDFIEKKNFICQIKRMEKINANSYNDLISFYADKGITTLHVFVLNEHSEFIGEHTTNFGMKVIIKSEESLNTDFSEKDYAVALKNIRQICKEESKTLLLNESYARKIANNHNTIVLESQKIWENCDCILDADILSKFNEDQNRYMQTAILKQSRENATFIQEFDFEKAKEERRKKEDLW